MKLRIVLVAACALVTFTTTAWAGCAEPTPDVVGAQVSSEQAWHLGGDDDGNLYLVNLIGTGGLGWDVSKHHIDELDVEVWRTTVSIPGGIAAAFDVDGDGNQVIASVVSNTATDDDLVLYRLDADGALSGPEPIATAPGELFSPEVSFTSNQGLVLAWGGSTGAELTQVDASGVAGAAIPLPQAAWALDAAPDGSFVVTGGGVAQKYGPGGTPVGSAISVASQAAVAMRPTGEFTIAYKQGSQLWSRTFDTDGFEVGVPVLVSQSPATNITDRTVHLGPDGHTLYGWSGNGIAGNPYAQAMFRVFDSSGSPLGDEGSVGFYGTNFAHEGSHFYPDGRFVNVQLKFLSGFVIGSIADVYSLPRGTYAQCFDGLQFEIGDGGTVEITVADIAECSQPSDPSEADLFLSQTELVGLGPHDVTLTVTDLTSGDVATCTTTVAVVDTTGPPMGPVAMALDPREDGLYVLGTWAEPADPSGIAEYAIGVATPSGSYNSSVPAPATSFPIAAVEWDADGWPMLIEGDYDLSVAARDGQNNLGSPEIGSLNVTDLQAPSTPEVALVTDIAADLAQMTWAATDDTMVRYYDVSLQTCDGVVGEWRTGATELAASLSGAAPFYCCDGINADGVFEELPTNVCIDSSGFTVEEIEANCGALGGQIKETSPGDTRSSGCDFTDTAGLPPGAGVGTCGDFVAGAPEDGPYFATVLATDIAGKQSALGSTAGSTELSAEAWPGHDEVCFYNDGFGGIVVGIFGSACSQAEDIIVDSIRLGTSPVLEIGWWWWKYPLAWLEHLDDDETLDLLVVIDDEANSFPVGVSEAILTADLVDGSSIQLPVELCVREPYDWRNWFGSHYHDD